jgi:hypothetical protein
LNFQLHYNIGACTGYVTIISVANDSNHDDKVMLMRRRRMKNGW